MLIPPDGHNIRQKSYENLVLFVTDLSGFTTILQNQIDRQLNGQQPANSGEFRPKRPKMQQ